jgi:hypothetical protein
MLFPSLTSTRSVLFAAIALTAVACGPTNTSDDDRPLFERTGGTFDKVALDARDGVAYLQRSTNGSRGVKSKLTILIGNEPNMCGAPTLQKQTTFFGLQALSADGEFKPGTFTQHLDRVPGQVDVFAGTIGEACKGDGPQWGAETATVTITSVTATAVSGTFEVTFTGNAGTLQGTFSVPVCESQLVPACQE